MTYGSGRLVATRAAPTSRSNLTDSRLLKRSAAGRFMRLSPSLHANRRTYSTTSSRINFSWACMAQLPCSSQLGLKADLYYLGFKDDQAAFAAGVADEERHTIGTRLFGNASGFDYDIEPVIQFGRFGRRGHSRVDVCVAGRLPLSGCRLAPATRRPIRCRQRRQVGRQTRHVQSALLQGGYFDDASVIRPSNIIDIHPTLQLLPRDNVLITIGSDVLWRYTTDRRRL